MSAGGGATPADETTDSPSLTTTAPGVYLLAKIEANDLVKAAKELTKLIATVDGCSLRGTADTGGATIVAIRLTRRGEW